MVDVSDNQPLTDLPAGVEELLAADGLRKKRRTQLVLFVVIPLVLAAAAVAFWYLDGQAAEREVAEAFNRASACLVGTPLADGEVASIRMRAMQLGALRSERATNSDASWPSRCAGAVAQLHQSLRKHGRDKDGAQGLAQQAETFAIALRKAQPHTDTSVAADALFAAAKQQGLAAKEVPLTVPSPSPIVGLTLGDLPDSARITPQQYTLDRVSSTMMVGTELHVLIYDKAIDPAPLLCSFSQTSGDRCRVLKGEFAGKSGLRLGGTADSGAAPLIFVGRDGEDGIFRSDTLKQVTALRAQSAYVSKDGYVAIASRALQSDGQFDLVQQASADQPPQVTRIKPHVFRPKINQIHRKQLLWGKLLVQVLDDNASDMKPRLQYKRLPAAKPNSAFTDIAPLGWVNAPVVGCKTADTVVVRVGSRRGFITFFQNERWSSPVPSNNLLGVFTCDRGEAVFTGDGPQLRCTAAGCKWVDGLPATFEPFPVRERAWTDLNGKVLSVALTDGRGGVRYRYAEGKNLQLDGADALLVDDLVYDGKVQPNTGILGMVLAGRGRYAVVLLSTRNGLYALRFNSDGKPTPAVIKR
ncbi:MAG TPA: hypothetical protein ENK23_09180 [Sorangium sp.]|nr:hypothetical protein [Sorangium sp.]